MKPMKSLTKPEEEIREVPQPEKPFVSIVTPAYNEAAIIEQNLTRLCEYMETLEDEYRWELIVVNDGSSDETGDLAEAFAKTRDNVHVLHHMYNFRLGQALRYAFNNCRGDYVVTIDVDLSYSPDHIGKLLAKIKETRAKIVIASPYTKGGKVSNVPWLRKTLSIWANRFLSLTVTKDNLLPSLSTLTGMVRAYDGRFLSRLNLKAMDVDIQPEILYKAMILRARIVEIPAHLNWGSDETGGKQRRSSIRLAKSLISSLLSGFMFRPFMLFILPGLVLVVLSLYPFAWIFIHTFHHFQNPALSGLAFDHRLSGAIALAFGQSPHAFIVGGVTLMLAIQLISLGILALQNKKYFEELFHISSAVYKSNKQDGNTWPHAGI
jgi:glycosyltransferase involved in cell wall biosynthesis